MNRKWLAIALLTVLLTTVLSGCFFKSVEELYALPKQTREYYDLQEEIDLLLGNDVGYAAPTSGANQQSVQLVDLDGDAEDEAIVFLKGVGETPLKAYIFDRVDDSFENIGVVEGAGASFESVEYVDIDGEAGLEMVVGRQLSEQVVQSLSVYSMRGGHMVELMSTNYSAYKTVDLNVDGTVDLVLLRYDSEERVGVAEYYHYEDGQMEKEPEVLMSMPAEAAKRIVTGDIVHGVPAVFVGSLYEEDSIITDVFVWDNDQFKNITTDGVTENISNNVQNYFVYATDIDGDGLIELPRPRQLPSAEEGENVEMYWNVDWYNLEIDGSHHHKITTYHNYPAGWYLVLPEEWTGAITVSRSAEVSGIKGFTFNQWNGYDMPIQPILTIYAFTGEDRIQMATFDNRFAVGAKGDVTYAAELHNGTWANNLTQSDVMELFHLIQVDWNSGETQ